MKDTLAYGTASRVSRWPPGTRVAYCNSGPAVLAAAVEKLSGKRFEDYVLDAANRLSDFPLWRTLIPECNRGTA